MDLDIKAGKDECHSLRGKMKNLKEKKRIGEILQSVSANGHSLLSVACCYGDINMVNTLLVHGATVVWGTEYEELAVTAISTLYRMHLRKRKWKKLPVKQRIVTKESRGYYMSLHSKLRQTIIQMKDIRYERRSPLIEAAYCGQYHVVDRLLRGGVNFISSCLTGYQLPLPPNPQLPPRSKNIEGRKYSLLEIAEMGTQRGDYAEGHGWVDEMHLAGRRMLNINKIKGSLALIRQRRDNITKNAVSKREKRDRLAAQAKLSESLVNALDRVPMPDWPLAVKLLDKGANPDIELRNGMTPLMVASMENPNGTNHEYCVDTDGRKVLQVALLLNRKFGRPLIDYENAKGWTAMNVAAHNGRTKVMQYLQECGADYNRANKNGMTPLMFAARNGKVDALRMLLEMGADSQLRDKDRKRAYEHGEHFETIVRVLSMMDFGVIDTLKASVGQATVRVPCLRGCGTILDKDLMWDHIREECQFRVITCKWGCGTNEVFLKDQEQHENMECPLREVKCIYLCGETILGKDYEYHKANYCKRRPIHCDACREEIIADKLDYHRTYECVQRKVRCPNECRDQVAYANLNHHKQNDCQQRIVRCRAGCGAELPFKDRNQHETHLCPFRTVSCKHRCREGVVMARDQLNHETKTCERRPVPCPNKCGENPRLENLEAHMKKYCLHRFIPCTKRGCDRKVRVADMGIHQEKECLYRLVKCPYCNSQFSAKGLEEHTKTCAYRETRCVLCHKIVKVSQLQSHKKYHCDMRTVTCKHLHCTKKLPAIQLAYHMRMECKKRLVQCLQGCKAEVQLCKREIHHHRECPERHVECPNQCGDITIRAKELETHLIFNCVKREI